ncbi:hypothetical protein VUR80DRAFT_5271 [Thermomyces stellatus]
MYPPRRSARTWTELLLISHASLHAAWDDLGAPVLLTLTHAPGDLLSDQTSFRWAQLRGRSLNSDLDYVQYKVNPEIYTRVPLGQSRKTTSPKPRSNPFPCSVCHGAQQGRPGTAKYHRNKSLIIQGQFPQDYEAFCC